MDDVSYNVGNYGDIISNSYNTTQNYYNSK